MANAVVIGAGMGGLAAAARLAALGHQVHVIEQSSRAGGKVATFEREGFRFDTGPSLLTLPAVYRDLFLKTAMSKRDARLEDNVDLQPIDPAFHYQWPDGARLTVPGSSTARVATAVSETFGATEGQQYRELMGWAAKVWSVTRAPFLETALTRRGAVMSMIRQWRDVPVIRPLSTLRSVAESTFHDAHLVQWLDRYATYSGSDPRRAPAALAVIPYVEQTFGAWHVGGGLGELANAVFQRCLQRGVRFTFDTAVETVSTNGDTVTGVFTADGQHVAANIVISDADASALYGTLVKSSASRRIAQRLQKSVPSFSGFVLLLALSGKSHRVAPHNVWFPEDYDAEFDSLFGRRQRAVPEPAIYAAVPDDPTMHPPDGEAWFVLVNAPRHDPEHGVDWRDPGVVDDYRQHLVNRLTARVDELSERILWSEVRTPVDLEEQTLSPGGSIYGTSSNSKSAAFARPSNRSPIRGLFLVGGSAHPGGGLPLVGLSAAIVADLVGPA